MYDNNNFIHFSNAPTYKWFFQHLNVWSQLNLELLEFQSTTSSKQEARALAVFFMADSSKNLEQMKVIWKKGTDPLLLACKSCIISDIWSYSYGCGNWPSTFQAKLAQRGATKDYKEVVKFNSKSPKISAYRQMFIF